MSSSSVTEMFDGIAPNYDFLNHFLSFQIDRIWRRKTSKLVAGHHPLKVLDVATGTADLALRMAKDIPEASIVGIDLSEKMLEIGRQKINREKMAQRIHLATADATAIPFPDNCFDAVTVAFGLRNFDDRMAGLREMARVCRHGGLIAVLEFSHPSLAWVKAPYRWYSTRWIPKVGQKISKHPSAYSYLPSSVATFPEEGAVIKMLNDAGVRQVEVRSLSGGIATLYYGTTMKNGDKKQ